MTYKMGDSTYEINELMFMDTTESILAEDDNGEYTIPVHANWNLGIFELLTADGAVYDYANSEDWK